MPMYFLSLLILTSKKSRYLADDNHPFFNTLSHLNATAKRHRLLTKIWPLCSSYIFPRRPPLLSLLALCLSTAVVFYSGTSLAADDTEAGISPNRPYIIGGDYNYPPYEFLDEDGKPAGYNVDLTRAIAEVMGMNIEFRFQEWSKVRQALAAGEIDALQGMVNSEQRQKTFDFSPPHAIIHQSIFARRGDPIASSLKQLRNKEVLVQNNGVMHDYLIQNDVGAILITVQTHADALRQLAAGKYDYALVANLPGLFLGEELGLSNIVPVGKPFQAQQYGYAVQKGDRALLAQFSEGLAILKNTGRQQQIYNQWLGPLQQKYLPWQQLGKIAASIAALLLLVLGGTMVWNRMLKRQVDKRTAELHIQQQQLIQADKMASLGILVSGVAHEINNPTGLLLLNLPIIEEAWHDSEEILQQHYEQQGDFILGGLAYSNIREQMPQLLADMHDAAQRIKRIVNDLKDFSRQEDDDSLEFFDLNTVTATAVRLLENSIKGSTDHFNTSYSQKLPQVVGNPQRIEQVLINLILNACQSLTDRQSAIRVTSYYEAEKQQVCLQIQDKGCGVSAANLPHMLDPFFTTRREQGGTGLGLSVSSGIVQSHGGHLHFESALEHGTTVTLTLPAALTDRQRPHGATL